MSAAVETTTNSSAPTVARREVVLVDLSSIAHPIWHMSQSEPDPNHTSIQTVAKVRALASGQPHVAVCCDSGRSFRAEIDPTYKANRPESDATLQHQITLARETLIGDGFPVWAVKGFEADDVIATAAKLAQQAGLEVLIVSSDKDLLQLVNGHVRAKSLRDGSILDAEAVVEKFSVLPEQMRDYLSLVGDTSDNVKGAKGIGPKKAAALLLKHGTLDKLYADIHEIGPQDLDIKPSEAISLDEFESRYPTVRKLIALRDDVEIPFSEIMADRVPKDAAAFGLEETMEEEMARYPAVRQEEPMETIHTSAESAEALTAASVTIPTPTNGIAVPEPSGPASGSLHELLKTKGAMEGPIVPVHEAELLPPAEWERQLDPRSMREAKILASDMFASRLFSAYGTPQGVLATVMVGRELGLPAMASLRSIHVIEGRHALSAALMVALVLKSGMAEYFEPISFSETEATFETKRRDARNPVRLQHTIEMAKTAGLLKEKSNWLKVPTDMLVARAQARLVRLVYPDLLAGLYSPEELQEVNGNA